MRDELRFKHTSMGAVKHFELSVVLGTVAWVTPFGALAHASTGKALESA